MTLGKYWMRGGNCVDIKNPDGTVLREGDDEFRVSRGVGGVWVAPEQTYLVGSFRLIDRRLNGLLILNGANRTDTTPSWQKYRSLGILRCFLQNQLSVVRLFIVVVAYILVGELWVQWQVARVGEVFRPLWLLQTQEGSQCQGTVGWLVCLWAVSRG